MSADFIDSNGMMPHENVREGYNRMMAFFESDRNDLGATFREVVISTEDWNAFARADRDARSTNKDMPTSAETLDQMA